MESCFASQHFSLCHSFASPRNRCRASDGGNIFSAKLLATAAKFFWLKVTSLLEADFLKSGVEMAAEDIGLAQLFSVPGAEQNHSQFFVSEA
jgi:hypothetical protein